MRLWGKNKSDDREENDLGTDAGLDAALMPIYDGVMTMLKGADLDPARYPSDVFASFDLTGSVEGNGPHDQHLYSGEERTMQSVGGLIAASAFALSGGTNRFDASFFNWTTIEIGQVTPANAWTFLDTWGDNARGGTCYIPVISWMLEKAGFPALDPYEVRMWGNAIRGNDFSQVHPLVPQRWTKRGKYGVLVSDGQPLHDDWEDLLAAIYLASQYPIFIECIGVGQDTFPHFDTFNNLPVQSAQNPYGRVFDNVGAFDSRLAEGDPGRMLGHMLGEYPMRYRDMMRLDMLHPSDG